MPQASKRPANADPTPARSDARAATPAPRRRPWLRWLGRRARRAALGIGGVLLFHALRRGAEDPGYDPLWRFARPLRHLVRFLLTGGS